MTITPCKTAGSDPNFSCSSSSQQSAPFWAKSDHFTSAENLENAGIIRKNISNPDYADTTITTSDESSEAMRIFAASPPDNFFHKRFSDHYSSNESLGVNKFRSRSNTNQSHKSEDASDSNEIKVGAFATKKMSSERAAAEADDDFLDLFNLTLEENKSRDEVRPPGTTMSPASVARTPPAVAKSKAVAEKSEAKKVLFFAGADETPAEGKKRTDFVMLETPFSAAATPNVNNPQGELGVFFKEVQSAPQIMQCNKMTDDDLEYQLSSLGEQLMSYENKSSEYDELLKTLETTATTSESESEAS